jgi:hypothetical protein
VDPAHRQQEDEGYVHIIRTLQSKISDNQSVVNQIQNDASLDEIPDEDDQACMNPSDYVVEIVDVNTSRKRFLVTPLINKTME